MRCKFGYRPGVGRAHWAKRLKGRSLSMMDERWSTGILCDSGVGIFYFDQYLVLCSKEVDIGHCPLDSKSLPIVNGYGIDMPYVCPPRFSLLSSNKKRDLERSG